LARLIVAGAESAAASSSSRSSKCGCGLLFVGDILSRASLVVWFN